MCIYFYIWNRSHRQYILFRCATTHRQTTDRKSTRRQKLTNKKIFTDTTTDRQRQVADTTTHRQKPITFLYKTDYHFGFRFIRMATGFSFIRPQRGKNKLVSEGYIYKVDSVREEKSYWVCHLPDCKGRCIQSNRKAMNRNWSNQKANPAPKTKAGNK